MADASLTLTRAHLALWGVLLACLLGLAAFGGAVLDRATPVVFWAWVVGAPLVGGFAVTVGRRTTRRGRRLLNEVLLVLWGIGVVGTLLLH